MPGIYIHIPFCKTFCNYCDFYSCTSLSQQNAMHSALLKEIEQRASFFQGTTTRLPFTLYFGGGTPSLFDAEKIAELINQAKETFGVGEFTELTLEANPDDLSLTYLAALRTAGVNRLSVGIQSFTDRCLQLMNRRHTASEAIQAVKLAQWAGFDNLSIDLIYGIPGMSLEEWEYSVKAALSLNVQHISAYHLTIEPDTVFGTMLEKGQLTLVDEDDSLAQFELLQKLLVEAGFEHYEISNFARDGRYARHNTAYWQGEPYIGIGPSAHSYNGAERRWNVADSLTYINNIKGQNVYFETELLDETDAYNEFVLLSLRTMWGIDLPYLKSRFGEALFAFFMRQAQKYLHTGKLVQKGQQITIPTQYFIIADSIILDLIKEKE